MNINTKKSKIPGSKGKQEASNASKGVTIDYKNTIFEKVKEFAYLTVTNRIHWKK